MRTIRRVPWALLAACALWTAPGAARAASAVVERGDNKNLDEARKLVAKGSFEPALEELKLAEGLPGASARQLAEIAALRASALLGLPATPERAKLADEALLQALHRDPVGIALQQASAAAQARAQALKNDRTLLLHERAGAARSDRPLLIQARLAGLPATGARVTLHYRVEPEAADQSGSDEEYVALSLDQQRNGTFEAYLRPGIGGMPNGGERVLRYYLEAVGADGALLDSNGTLRDPVRAQLTGKEIAAAINTALTVDEGAKRPVVEVPTTPWYKRWQIVAPAAGILAAGAVTAIILMQPKPQATPGTLGKVDLP
jgi:hypothetical protein